MRRTVSIEAPNLLSEINTTPLIDVMLVLLVMLIITIPAQRQVIKLDLPAGSPRVQIDRHSNLLTIDAHGLLRWNGVALDRNELRQELASTRQMSPSPELHLRPDADSRHGDVDQLLAAIKREQISRFGFVGNEAYQNTF